MKITFQVILYASPIDWQLPRQMRRTTLFCYRCCLQPSGEPRTDPRGPERRHDAMNRHVSGALRVVRSAFRGGNDEESFQFARFHDDTTTCDSTEMSTIANGDAAGRKHSCSNEKVPDSQGTAVDDDETPEKNKITEWQAGWNVTNAIQGMFIVTFPYAVLEGGYWAILAMIFFAIVCCYTGEILVDCLYEECPATGKRKRVRNSYVAVAEAVWGARIGGRIVYTAQIIELLMTCILYVLLCGDLLIGSFPNTPLDLSSWTMLASAMLLPCAFLRTLQRVSLLSFWCTVAHMFINAIILVYCLTRASEWKWNQVLVRIDIWTFPISLGIIVFSYTSQIFLPTLEGKLRDRSRFKCMLHWTHVAAAIFKAGFSYVGFLTFGFETKEVITNNLPNVTMRVLVNLFLVVKALLSYPLPYFAAVELLQDSFFGGRATTACPPCFEEAAGGETEGSGGPLKVWGLVLRLGIVAFTLVMAIFLPHFAILMGLIGSITGNMLSLVWPCYFHLSIKRYSLRWYEKAIDVAIITLGLVCAGLGIYYSGHALVEAFRGKETRPFQLQKTTEFVPGRHV